MDSLSLKVLTVRLDNIENILIFIAIMLLILNMVILFNVYK